MRFVNADGVSTASHLPALRWAHETAGGSVLEFGGGLYSTAYLYELDALGVETATIEADPEWRDWLEETYPGHRVVAEMPEGTWGTVLIDHGEGEWEWIDTRAAALEAVRGRCGIALVHDWHIGIGHRDDIVTAYTHHGWYAPDDGTMHTALCSDIYEVRGAQIEGGNVYTGWDDAPEEYPN